MKLWQSLAVDLAHAAFWFALLAATLLFAGGNMSYIYTQF